MTQPTKPTLEMALMNAVKPSYDLHIICPHCEQSGITNNGEWLLWCGAKEHAQAILDAARKYLEIRKIIVDDYFDETDPKWIEIKKRINEANGIDPLIGGDE